MQMQVKTKGFTVIELLFVGLLILTIFLLIFTSATAMLRSGRVSNSTQKIVSTINLARNLAITHNSIYHVRIQNYAMYPQQVGAGWNYVEHREQVISVHCFPNTSEALKINSIVRKPTAGERIGYPRSAGPAPAAGAPQSGDAWSWQPTLNGTNNNYLVERVLLETGTYFGIQYNPNTTPTVPDDDVALYFLPDGTASENMTLFVTNEIQLRDSPAPPPPAAFNEAEWLEINRGRYNLFNNTAPLSETLRVKISILPQIEMVQIYKGGMVRALKGERTP